LKNNWSNIYWSKNTLLKIQGKSERQVFVHLMQHWVRLGWKILTHPLINSKIRKTHFFSESYEKIGRMPKFKIFLILNNVYEGCIGPSLKIVIRDVIGQHSWSTTLQTLLFYLYLQLLREIQFKITSISLFFIYLLLTHNLSLIEITKKLNFFCQRIFETIYRNSSSQIQFWRDFYLVEIRSKENHKRLLLKDQQVIIFCVKFSSQ
jgi:hypothetical protein